MKLYLKRSIDDTLPQLGQLVELLSGLKWSVLYASGVREGNALPSEWVQIRELPRGLLLTDIELAKFDLPGDEHTELNEALIIGAFDSRALSSYEDRGEMEARCDVVLDLADGDSWLISAKDAHLLKTIAEAFPENEPTFVD